MSMWMMVVAILFIGLLAAVFLTPRDVRYTEQIDIAAPVADVYNYIRFQRDLMRWSAWPTETKSTCMTEGPDGQVGAQTVFISKGKRFGHQEITQLAENEYVELAIFSAGPPQRTLVRFSVKALGPLSTQVQLHMKNKIAYPFNLILRLVGVVRWVRRLHVKDLQGLKRFSEFPRRTYSGDPVLPPVVDGVA